MLKQELILARAKQLIWKVNQTQGYKNLRKDSNFLALERIINNQTCHNCKNRYPKYLNYDQGPCDIFKAQHPKRDWAVIDFDTGCDSWKDESHS